MQMVLPALALFFGSFLLFGIQPMLGRTLLPPFGGSAAVWTVCLAAYQLLLLAGYGYAHLLARRGARVQRVLHLALLGAAVLWTLAFAAWRLALKERLGFSAAPSLEVFGCVLVFAGLPYVLLSANSTLIQAWLAGACGQGVYRLYAVSNLGSLLGLLAYPFVLEPYVSLDAQWRGFAAALALYTLLLAAVARRTRPAGGPNVTAPPPEAALAPPPALPPALARPWLWFGLPALSAFLLNAVTTHLSTDVTPFPMMWVLLLAAFLLSYVVGFSRAGERGVLAWAGAAVVALLAAAYASGLTGGRSFLPNLAAGLAVTFFGCVFLHGWLYRIRPGAEQLTRFYLGIAAGGAAGGACASLVAPLAFNQVFEYPLGLLLASAAAGWVLYVGEHPELRGLCRFLQAVAVGAAVLAAGEAGKNASRAVARARNFYGCLAVYRDDTVTPFGDAVSQYSLRHGDTVHGLQVHERLSRRRPTTYYGPPGGGLGICSHARYLSGAPMRVGVVGLGAGTLACYGRTNDVYRFFEINPQVIRFATDTNYFTFVADSAAKVELDLGDARKRLERERERREPAYDVLVVDAYSGDSIPFHLATREAFRLYLDRLAPGGTLAVHISNWHINLAPLCKAVAAEFGLHATGVVSPKPDGFLFPALWVFLTAEPASFACEGTREMKWERVRDIGLPTDERGSLLPLIRLGYTPPMKEVEVDLNKLF